MNLNQSKQQSSNRKFKLFIIPIDEYSTKDLRHCGWYCDDGSLSIRPKNLMIFIEKEDGHGSINDWISLLKEKWPNSIITHKYIN